MRETGLQGSELGKENDFFRSFQEFCRSSFLFKQYVKQGIGMTRNVCAHIYQNSL